MCHLIPEEGVGGRNNGLLICVQGAGFRAPRRESPAVWGGSYPSFHHRPRSDSMLPSNHLGEQAWNMSSGDISKDSACCEWGHFKPPCFKSLLERNEGNAHQNKMPGALEWWGQSLGFPALGSFQISCLCRYLSAHLFWFLVFILTDNPRGQRGKSRWTWTWD